MAWKVLPEGKERSDVKAVGWWLGYGEGYKRVVMGRISVYGNNKQQQQVPRVLYLNQP